MSQGVIVRILLLTVALITYFRNVSASGRRFSRNRACNLLLPPGTITYSYIVSKRSECLAVIAPLKDACCTIYDNTTRNCTIALTDRFHLVPNSSASLEVGIDMTFTTCSPNPERSVLNALPPASWLFYSRQSGSVSSLSLQCVNSAQAPLNYTFTCNPNGMWQVAEFAICGGGSQIFNVSGSFSFVVPNGVSYVRAVVVGGGGGGTNGHQPGGGGGYVNCSIVSVTSGQSIGVIVGAGGTGAATSSDPSIIVGNTDGGASSFGWYLVAGGGSSCGVTAMSQYGCSGGTGSGANCWYFCPAGTVGGTGGSAGNNGASTPPNTPNGGHGIGATAYYACLNLTKLHSLTAGAGGVGGQPYINNVNSWSASGGGGGVLIDGSGPAAQNGLNSIGYAGSGGIGFGAGGGGGGFYDNPTSTCYAGGNGAGGIVYIEWD